MFLGPRRLLQLGVRVARCNTSKAILQRFVLLRFNASRVGRCLHVTHTRVVDTLARPRPPWHLHVLYTSPPRRALFRASRGVLLPFRSFVRLVSFRRTWSVVVTCVACVSHDGGPFLSFVFDGHVEGREAIPRGREDRWEHGAAAPRDRWERTPGRTAEGRVSWDPIRTVRTPPRASTSARSQRGTWRLRCDGSSCVEKGTILCVHKNGQNGMRRKPKGSNGGIPRQPKSWQRTYNVLSSPWNGLELAGNMGIQQVVDHRGHRCLEMQPDHTCSDQTGKNTKKEKPTKKVMRAARTGPKQWNGTHGVGRGHTRMQLYIAAYCGKIAYRTVKSTCCLVRHLNEG